MSLGKHCRAAQASLVITAERQIFSCRKRKSFQSNLTLRASARSLRGLQSLRSQEHQMTISANAANVATVQKTNPAQAARSQLAAQPDPNGSPFGKLVSEIARQGHGPDSSKS
jgi:hypothetical protein